VEQLLVRIVEWLRVIVSNKEVEDLLNSVLWVLNFQLRPFSGLIDEEVSEPEWQEGDNNESNQPSDSKENLASHSEEVSGMSEALQQVNDTDPNEERS